MAIVDTTNPALFFRNIFVQLMQQPTEVVESEQLEIKGWCKDEKEFAEKLVESACCIANAKGGAVLGGIGGKHKVFSACPYGNVNSAWIENRIKDQSVPPVDCEVFDLTDLLEQVRGVRGATAFGLIVPKSKFLTSHVTTRGVSRIRQGKECKPYFTAADDDRTRAMANEACESDLSVTSIEWAMGKHQSKFGVSRIDEDVLQFVERMRLVERTHCTTVHGAKYRITLAALILFGKETALRRILPNLETVVSFGEDHIRIRRNLIESVRDLVFSDKSPIVQRCQNISQKTILELLMNAYIHRCWRTPGPIVVRITQLLEIQNPGELMPGLNVANLLHCVPSYRNFLLAESSRYVGLCDKLGKGIGLVFESVLKGGLDIPIFESGDNSFTVRISLGRSDHFREFVRIRSASLVSTDEILTLRALWERRHVSLAEIAQVLQRGFEQTETILRSMEKKLMVERTDPERFILSPVLRADIDRVFEINQLNLFGG